MITQNWLEVGPAYGRDYKSAAAVRQDWNDGKDFMMLSVMHGVDAHGTYCSKKDFATGTSVIVRYGKMMKTTTVEA